MQWMTRAFCVSHPALCGPRRSAG